jgi:hypothetical protein
MILAGRKEYKEAAEQFRTYLELRPDSPVVAEIQHYLHEWEALRVIDPKPAAAAAAAP